MFADMRMIRFPMLCLAASTLLPVGATTIDITYNFVPIEAQAAIQRAADIWEGILVSSIPIKATVTWVPMGGSALGITFPNGRKDFPSAPIAQTWYATALANSIAEAELNPGENDFDVFLDSGTDWYFGLDGETPNDQYDLVSVALHEMGHGLGFVGLGKKEGSIGSFGLLQQSDFAPLITSFPWPQLDTLPGIFDRFLAHPVNGPLELMENPSAELGSAMTSNQVRFNGAYAMEANGGTGPRIYSPSGFNLGSSCVHFNESTFPQGNANELMTPFSPAGDANHWPGPVCIGVMRDIGWTLAPEVGLAEDPPGRFIRAFPNPTDDVLFIAIPGAQAMVATILDSQGRIERHVRFHDAIDVRDLASGPYMIQVDELGKAFPFIKK